MKQSVFLIILNFNGGRAVSECLESVWQMDSRGIDLNVVVVDNNSTDGSREMLQKFKSSKVQKFKVIENQENLGFAEGNNIGIRYSLKNGADWVFLLNNDTEVARKALVRLIKVGNSNKRTGILAPKIYFAEGYEFHRERYSKEERGRVIWYAGGKIDWQNVIGQHRGVDEVDRGQYDQITETDFISGCAMLIKRKVLEKIGNLDEKYFLYYEDADFCQRAKKRGFKLVFVPKAKVWHKNLGTGRTGSELQDYYLTRNRLLFGMRWAPFQTKLALAKQSIGILLKGRYFQKKAVRDFYLRKLGKGSYQNRTLRESPSEHSRSAKR